MPRIPILALSAALGAMTLLCAMPAFAQPGQPPAVPIPPAATAPPQGPGFPQLSLSASAFREVTQDRVAVTLAASQEGAEPGPAQAQVNERLSPVLEKLKGHKDLEVESAGYRTDPVWKDAQIVSWRAHGAIRITATPSEEFNKLIGQLSSQLNVESVTHFLSRDAQLAVEQELIDEAVAAYRAKAQTAAQALGYRNWTIRSVSLNDSGPGQPQPLPRMMMARSASVDAAPMPISEGRTTVSVSVGGTVVLER